MRFADPIEVLLTLALCTYCADAQQADDPVHRRVSIPETEVRHIQSSIAANHMLVVTDNGTKNPSISVIDVNAWSIVQIIPVPKSWLGLHFIENGKRFLVTFG